MREIGMAIEELSLDGEISLKDNVSDKTLQNWCNDINRTLQHDNCNWQAAVNWERRTIVAVPVLEQEEDILR